MKYPWLGWLETKVPSSNRMVKVSLRAMLWAITSFVIWLIFFYAYRVAAHPM
jgi:hypothetical protein